MLHVPSIHTVRKQWRNTWLQRILTWQYPVLHQFQTPWTSSLPDTLSNWAGKQTNWKMLLSLFSTHIFRTLTEDSVKSDNCIIKIFTWLIKLFRSTYCLVKIHGKPHVHAVPHKLYTAAGPTKLWYHPYCKTKTTTKHQKCQLLDI